MKKTYFPIKETFFARQEGNKFFANQLANPEGGVITFARPGSKQYAAIQNLAELFRHGRYSKQSLQQAIEEASRAEATDKFKITIQIQDAGGTLRISINENSVGPPLD